MKELSANALSALVMIILARIILFACSIADYVQRSHFCAVVLSPSQACTE